MKTQNNRRERLSLCPVKAGPGDFVVENYEYEVDFMRLGVIIALTLYPPYDPHYWNDKNYDFCNYVRADRYMYSIRITQNSLNIVRTEVSEFGFWRNPEKILDDDVISKPAYPTFHEALMLEAIYLSPFEMNLFRLASDVCWHRFFKETPQEEISSLIGRWLDVWLEELAE